MVEVNSDYKHGSLKKSFGWNVSMSSVKVFAMQDGWMERQWQAKSGTDGIPFTLSAIIIQATHMEHSIFKTMGHHLGESTALQSINDMISITYKWHD